MKQRLLASAVLALLVAGCGGDDRVTGPASPLEATVLNAIGTDPVTGATIETNQDDYVPGEVVHVAGRGWAPGETVNLFMTEEPDSHDDVSMDVTADANGEFSVHFYDVEPHDLGVTFTLTATGGTSGSVAMATFTDGNFTIRSAPAEAPEFTGSILRFSNSAVCDPSSSGQGLVSGTVTSTSGPNNQVNGTSASGRITVPATLTGYTFSHWTFSGPVNLTAGTTATDASICVEGTAGGPSGLRVFTANYVAAANAAPVLDPIDDPTVDENTAVTFDANATDTDAGQTLTFSLVGAPTGAMIDPITGEFSWTPTDGPSQTTTFSVRVTDNGTPALFDEKTVTVTVNNVAPTATFNAPTSVDGGSTINLSLTSPVDPSPEDVAAGFTYAFDCGDGSGYGAASATNTASCPTSGTGSRDVQGKIIDKDGGETEYTASVAINNVAPTAEAGGPYSGNEGSAIAISGSGNDPDGGTVTYAWSVNAPPGTCTFADASAASTTVTCNDNGNWTLTLTVTDDETASATDNASLEVANVAPTATFNAPSSVNEGSPINISLTGVVDPSSADVAAGFTYAFDCGSGVFSSFASSNSTACATSDDGTITVKGKVRDKDGGESEEYSATVTVLNVAPVLNVGAATATINEGDTFNRAGSFTDPGADSWMATVNYGDGSGNQSLTLNADKTFNLSHAYPRDGSFTITVSIQDDDGGSDTETITITVNNVLPVVNAGPDKSIFEGETFMSSGSFTDPGADTWTATVNYGDGSGTQALALNADKTFSLSHTYADDGSYAVTVTVNDDDGAGSDNALVTVTNVDPTITDVSANPLVDGNVYSVDQDVTVQALFTDPGTQDTHSCTFAAVGLSGATVNATGAGNSMTGQCSGILDFSIADVYQVTVTVTDDDGGSDTETIQVVIYDPSAGFVTGGGWISVYAGSYRPDQSLSGKGTFGFVSKYQRGAKVPTGNTQFVFHAADFNFHSTDYEWLVVNQGGTNAQFKGSGTVNGAAGYSFMLWATDGTPDTFRIKIWRSSTNEVVFDNLYGQADDMLPQQIGGGSIQVHTGGNGNGKK